MTFEQQWIEYDYNPFILFSASGKIISLNAEAQYLLGSIDRSTLFEIASTYASASFGFKTTFLDLEFGRYKFFGITVGYENEDEIGIRLYQIPSLKFSKPKPTGELINIYTLVDLCISTNSIGSSTEFTKDFDPTIPEIRLNAEPFIKLMNKIYASMQGSEKIETRIYFRVGEHIKYEEVKYTLFSVEVLSETFNQKRTSEIVALAEESNLFTEIKEDRVTVNIPMISK
jgi:hypothetical protein